MRIVLALAALIFLATFAPLSLYSPAEPMPGGDLSAERLPLNEKDPRQRRLGGLVYLEGWSLRSDNPRFGGISAMHVENGEVTALSDSGSVIRFAIPAQGKAGSVRIDALKEGPGSPNSKRDRDSEAMVVGDDHVWIGFESSNAVWRYSRASGKAEASARPEAMEDWPGNAGAEGMLRLPDGRFLIFSEGDEEGGFNEALLFEGDPAEAGTPAAELRYRPPEGYRLTDAAWLPDGRALLLNRRFSILEGVSARLLVADLTELGEGLIIEGEELASFSPPVTVDNLEALSVTQENGRTIVWIASDDNFTPIQRTLLMKFALAE